MNVTPFDEWYESVLTPGIAQRTSRSVLEAAFDAGVMYAEWTENPINEPRPEWIKN